MIFLHADALHLPFAAKTFNTVISLNLIHVLDDLDKLLHGLKNVLTADGKMFFTTLVKKDRLADRYLKLREDAGEVICRTIDDFRIIFEESGMSFTSCLHGNMAFIQSQ